MNAKCVKCELYWNISMLQKIPKEGYICPHCEGKKHRGEWGTNFAKIKTQEAKGK